ncbi:MAG: hypothetical protein V4637_12710 [Pseudomonadota bacterium]
MLRQFGGVLMVVASLLVGGCATQPVMNVTQSSIASRKANLGVDEVRQSILTAGSRLGWEMRVDRPGHITGRFLVRNHAAIVDIDYTPTNYSIKYRDSINLDYDGSNIHRGYNRWIQNLDQAIQVEFKTL